MSYNVPADQVSLAFRCLLGRLPESDATLQAFQSLGGIEEVIATIKNSQEAVERFRIGPFWNYNTQIDALGILKSHEDKQRLPVEGRFVNYLGVIIDPAIYPPLLASSGGKVEGLPLPSNWHADIAEFAAALRAVDLAKGRFCVLELGCGWGCWLLNTGVAARNRGLEVELIGAEGDEGHVAFAEAALSENRFSPSEARIVRGVVGPNPGTALFPRQDLAGTSWGLEPIFEASSEQIAKAEHEKTHDVLPILTLGSLTRGGRAIDLVHIDIQGGEADFIENCILDLNRLTRYIVIGTHSRIIEGRIFDVLFRHGWILEIERPAIFGFDQSGKPTTHIDGVQGWRNPKLVLDRD